MELKFLNEDFRLAVFAPSEGFEGSPEEFYERAALAAKREKPDFIVFFSFPCDDNGPAKYIEALIDLCPGAVYPGDGSAPVLWGFECEREDFAVRVMGRNGLLRWAFYLFGPIPKDGAYLRTELYRKERKRLDALYYECGSILFTYEPLPELSGGKEELAQGLLCAAIEDKRALALVSGSRGGLPSTLRHMDKDVFIGSEKGSLGRVFVLNSNGRHGYQTKVMLD